MSEETANSSAKTPRYKRHLANYLIDKDFQLRFFLNFSLLFIFGLLLTLGFLFWIHSTKYDKGVVFRLRQDTVKVYQKGFEIVNGEEKDKFVEKELALPDYDHGLDLFTIQFKGILLFSMLYLLLSAIFVLVYSHKMAGPIYNIKKNLKLLLEGKDVDKIRIRSGDEFQDLADLLNELIDKKIHGKKN
ncbi:hypothetical protein [Leptospira licerasiae]|uniref:HAMP domain-containing protein n=1 Tax=Leptospira licerasiae str. MMD4847 TaxID=1049971 RepID=A0ABN0HEQ4_9LEPT|nr:hypothetical protein [Leptospira licerasiae]EIE01131.1 hypothetical protein LEP1GSC185_3702 [Leptospira licerasiae serovar Varillal str. VAR 010]EJZ44052.1 hypothetical protein LEP1GSC178_2193 [Leptospira licerasiae str. MMD4847]TGM88868.1 hypothetical protein EHR05_11715 [Leptospira licerasiae]